MEIIGDDKRLKALYNETRFVDEQAAPSFSATWHRAQARATRPRRALNLAFTSAMALVVLAVATFAIWSKYSEPSKTYSASATAAAVNLAPRDRSSSEATSPTGPVKPVNTQIRSRVNRLVMRQQQLVIAENRRVEKEAKEIASWESPTASLLSSSSDNLFRSLPQLNENANELKSFLPNRSNDKEK